MVEQLRFVDGKENPRGVKVMGMTSDGVLFEGVTADVSNYFNPHHGILTVTGKSYNGIEIVDFKMDVPIGALKVYDEDIYNRLTQLMQDYAISVENMIYFENTMKGILK